MNRLLPRTSPRTAEDLTELRDQLFVSIEARIHLIRDYGVFALRNGNRGPCAYEQSAHLVVFWTRFAAPADDLHRCLVLAEHVQHSWPGRLVPDDLAAPLGVAAKLSTHPPDWARVASGPNLCILHRALLL